MPISESFRCHLITRSLISASPDDITSATSRMPLTQQQQERSRPGVPRAAPTLATAYPGSPLAGVDDLRQHGQVPPAAPRGGPTGGPCMQLGQRFQRLAQPRARREVVPVRPCNLLSEYSCLMAQPASAIINLFLEICVLHVRACIAFSGLHALRIPATWELWGHSGWQVCQHIMITSIITCSTHMRYKE